MRETLERKDNLESIVECLEAEDAKVPFLLRLSLEKEKMLLKFPAHLVNPLIKSCEALWRLPTLEEINLLTLLGDSKPFVTKKMVKR